jgi:uncharacterized protein (DUF736 family)
MCSGLTFVQQSGLNTTGLYSANNRCDFPIDLSLALRRRFQKGLVMNYIGTFQDAGNGVFRGEVKTATLRFFANIVPVERQLEGGPTHTVIVDGTRAQIGSAWKKTAQTSGKDYLSMTLDDPSFPGPIQCKLLEGEGQFDLVWERR